MKNQVLNQHTTTVESHKSLNWFVVWVQIPDAQITKACPGRFC